MINHIISSFNTQGTRVAFVSTTDPEFPFAVIDETSAARNIYTRNSRQTAAQLYRSLYLQRIEDVVPLDATL